MIKTLKSCLGFIVIIAIIAGIIVAIAIAIIANNVMEKADKYNQSTKNEVKK